jgi:hypothetical protein
MSIRRQGSIGQQGHGATAGAYVRHQFIVERTRKRRDRAEADRFVTYPYEAVEEALANAVYHRGYDVREPIEVTITLTITSYPGPDASVRVDAFKTGRAVARRYRNRRIGEFLKELRLTEGRGIRHRRRADVLHDDPADPPGRDRITHANGPTEYGTTRGDSSDRARDQVRDQVGDQVLGAEGTPLAHARAALLARDKVRAILAFARVPRSRAELQRHVGASHATYFRRSYLRPLLETGLLAYTQPDAPRAPNQRYVTTPLAERLLHEPAGDRSAWLPRDCRSRGGGTAVTDAPDGKRFFVNAPQCALIAAARSRSRRCRLPERSLTSCVRLLTCGSACSVRQRVNGRLLAGSATRARSASRRWRCRGA